MTSSDPAGASPAASAQMGARISRDLPVVHGRRMELLGTGGTFAAWRAARDEAGADAEAEAEAESAASESAAGGGGADLVVRVPWRPGSVELADEVAGIALAPAGIGPEVIAWCEDTAASEIGTPYMVTTAVEGEILPPSAWTREHLLAHARQIAALHRVAAPGRGPVSPEPEPWRRAQATGVSLAGWLRRDRAELAQRQASGQREGFEQQEALGLDALLDAAGAWLERQDPLLTGGIDWVLCHGDLCATNVVWAPGPTLHPRFIDFEWAMADDPARDLAIIGGPVHGGPWYVPMDDAAIDALIAEYVRERRRLAGLPPSDAQNAGDVCGARSVRRSEASQGPRESRHPEASRELENEQDLEQERERAERLDPRALRARRDAWEVYEKTAMLLVVAQRAQRGEALYGDALPVLRSTLERRLGLTPARSDG